MPEALMFSPRILISRLTATSTKVTMKLAVFGGTGASGEQFIEQALAKGHEVVAIVRNPDKVKAKHANLQIVVADIFNAEELLPHLVSCEAVVSCLGSEYKQFSEITLYSQSARAITSAMARASIKRFVFMSTFFVEDKPDHPWYARFFIKPFLRRFMDDLQRMEKFLVEECPNIDFTSVRPPSLSNGKLDPQEAIMEPDVDYSTLTTVVMPRANVAQCMLYIVENNLYPRRSLAIGLPK